MTGPWWLALSGWAALLALIGAGLLVALTLARRGYSLTAPRPPGTPRSRGGKAEPDALPAESANGASPRPSYVKPAA